MTVTSLKQGRYSRDPVEILGTPLAARQLAAGAASTNVALTATARAVSIRAVGCDIRFLIGSTAQTALSTSHFISDGERLDFNLNLATPNIAAIRNASVSGTLEITELY
jgi:hypothetical protein